MSVNKFINELLSFKLDTSHKFNLPNSNNNSTPETNQSPEILTKSLTKNLEIFSSLYSQEINSDICIRKFILNSQGKQYNASLIFIDGLINSDLINHFLLTPLMHKNLTNCENLENNLTTNQDGLNCRTTKKTNLEQSILDSLVTQNSLSTEKEISEILNKINGGFTCLLVDTLDVAFCVEAKGFQTRSITKPENEIVVRGPQEAFVENIRVNTSIIRRAVNNENLVIEQLQIGNITKTAVAFCYMKNIANEDLVNEVRYRLNNVDIDSLLSSGVLEQLIQDNSHVLYPQMFATERADRTCNNLLQGRVIILVNGSPYALIAPAVLVDFLSSPEDNNIQYQYGNLARIIRCLAFFVAMFLPSFYIAITNFHQELLPTDIVFAIASMRKSIPFPIIFELLIMEVSFELIREASLRVPSPIGATIGIIGGLILGEAAVSANLVSPLLIIIVAMTGICSYAIPDFSLNFTIRCFRFVYLILGYTAGFLGISLGIFIQLILLSNLQSFGVSYFSPYIPIGNKNADLSFLMKPAWQREKRSSFLNTKRPKQEEKISMKWKTNKGVLK